MVSALFVYGGEEQAALGDDQFDQLWTEGTELSLDDAVARAHRFTQSLLNEPSPPVTTGRRPPPQPQPEAASRSLERTTQAPA